MTQNKLFRLQLNNSPYKIIARQNLNKLCCIKKIIYFTSTKYIFKSDTHTRTDTQHKDDKNKYTRTFIFTTHSVDSQTMVQN